MTLLELVFWISAAVVAYCYVGYAMLISLIAWLRPRPHRKAPIRPTVSLIIAAYNEEQVIRAKIVNSLCQTYPRELMEILVVSDGSTDDTPAIVQEYWREGVISLHQPVRLGKPAAVNRALQYAQGEILVFSDANSMYSPDAIEKLVRNFADPEVGCVAGEKRIKSDGGSPAGIEAGLYWRYESFLKRMDSLVNCVVGAAGEIYAVRSTAFQMAEPDSIIEDFIVSMRIAASGHRVVYEPEAVSVEEGAASFADEFERRCRIAAGGFQAMVRLRGILASSNRLLVFQYVSHRLLRWAVVPFLLPVLLVSNCLLAWWPPYQALLAVQLTLVGLASLGWTLEATGRGACRLTHVPLYFYMLNVAALAGFCRYLSGRQSAAWKRTNRYQGESVRVPEQLVEPAGITSVAGQEQ